MQTFLISQCDGPGTVPRQQCDRGGSHRLDHDVERARGAKLIVDDKIEAVHDLAMTPM
jgi:hypothetical protein